MTASRCPEIRALLSEHLEGELAAGDEARVREHLAGCAGCRAQAALLRRTVEALRAQPELPPPAAILAGVRAHLHRVPWHRRLLERRPWLLGVPVGAVATIAVVVGVALFQARYPGMRETLEPRVAPARRDLAPAPAPAPEALRDAAAPPATVPESLGRVAKSAPSAAPSATPSAAAPQVAGPQPRPEPPPAAPAAPAAPVATAPTARPPAGAEERGFAPVPALEKEAAAKAERLPSRFVIPEPEPQTAARLERREPDEAAPRAKVARLPRALDEAPAGPATPPGRSGFRTAGAEPSAAGPDPFGTVTLRGPARDRAPGRSAPALEGAEDVTVATSLRRDEAAPWPESLVLALAPDGELDDVKAVVRREGGRLVETRVVDPRARRERLAGRRGREEAAAEFSRGWQITVRAPRESLRKMAEALQRRPGVRVLERRDAGPAPGRAPAQEHLRITVYR